MSEGYIEKKKIPSPNGQGRVEGLVIGVVPAASAAIALLTATFIGAAAYFSIDSKIASLESHIRTVVVLLTNDRWTRSDQEALCRWQEKNAQGGSIVCPEKLPKNLDLSKVLGEILSDKKRNSR